MNDKEFWELDQAGDVLGVQLPDSRYWQYLPDAGAIALDPQGSQADELLTIMSINTAILLELERIANALEAGNEDD